MSEEADITWKLEMERLAGSEAEYLVDATFAGNDWAGEGSFEVWLSTRSADPEAEVAAWEGGMILTRREARKLHRFLGAWLGPDAGERR